MNGSHAMNTDSDSRAFTGKWSNGKKEGRGVYKYANGDVYDGDWKNDKFDGHGVLRYADGDIYDGDWKGGKKDGHGVLKYARGDVYDGFWVDDEKEGRGLCQYASGNLYDGDWKDGSCDGRGIFKYNNGDVYDGDWKDGKKEGHGVYTYEDGDVYDGDWKCGNCDGRGVFKYINGDYYDGEWINDKKEGRGQLKYANGDVYEGDWKDDKKEGGGVYAYVNGDVYDGDWRNGVQVAAVHASLPAAPDASFPAAPDASLLVTPDAFLLAPPDACLPAAPDSQLIGEVGELEDALSPALYAEFLQCKDLPLYLQDRDEVLAAAIFASLKERRLKDASALKAQRLALGHTPSGVSAADMRARLTALVLQFDHRYDDRAEACDNISCEYCLQHQEIIQSILDSSPIARTPLTVCTSFGSTTTTSSVPSTPTSPLHGSVLLQTKLTEGKKSSGKSVIANGLYTAAHEEDQVVVQVKVSNGSEAARARHEYKTMARLHQTAPDYFVRPYAYLEGCQGQIQPHVPEDEAYCATAVCIVMEKGTIDMHEYFAGKKKVGQALKLAFFDEMLDILISSSHCRIVLCDFKPANIVSFSDGCYYRLKAIDFDSSRQEGEEMSAEATAAYSSPEVAREILARARGERPSPLLASHKMDVMSLGWLAYEIANDMKSYWKNQTPPIIEHADILAALSCLTDKDVQRDIQRTFSSPQHDALRTWLCHALKVNPNDRASALDLRHGHSLFGSKDRTLDEKGLLSQIDKRVEKIIDNSNWNTTTILESIEELSDQLEMSLGLLGASIDCVAAQVAKGSEEQTKGIAALVDVVHECRFQVLQGGPLDENALKAAVTAAMSTMEKTLSHKICTSLNGMISSTGPSPIEKLDVLMDMVSGLQSQNDCLAEDFGQFRVINECQSSLLEIIEMNGNNMPLTFVIVPGIDYSEKLPSGASNIDKMKNFAKRKVRSVTRILWDESRVVFICPVTLEQVRCGPEGNGYDFKIPTHLVKVLAPALRWGLLAMKIILASQGLGCVVPQTDLLSHFHGDAIDAMMSQVLGETVYTGSYATDAVNSAKAQVKGSAKSFVESIPFNEDQAKKAYGHIFKFLQDQEGGGGPGWKPTMTGLYLTAAPPGKGRAMWVSEEGRKQFQLCGEDAIKKIGSER